MKLTEAKKIFHRIRKDKSRIFVTEHAYDDYPERAFTEQEVVKLLMNIKGSVEDTTDSRFRGERFYWRTKDLRERDVRIVFEIDEDESGNLVVAISAWREV